MRSPRLTQEGPFRALRNALEAATTQGGGSRVASASDTLYGRSRPSEPW